MTKFDKIYKEILRNIIENGAEEFHGRTAKNVMSLPGVCFSVDLEKDGFPLTTLREISVRSFIAEQVWFLQGGKDTSFLRKFTKIWDLFTEPNGEVAAAYGWRWRKAFNRDQLWWAISLLKTDPSSRHGVVVTWDPREDGYGGKEKKNVPCPFAFTINIIGGRLHMQNMVRSNDMVLGFPFDVAGFALLQCILAQEIGVKPGVYTHFISNAHIYEDHYAAAREIIARENIHEKISISLPLDTLKKAESKEMSLVEDISSRVRRQYNPMPKIAGLKISI